MKFGDPIVNTCAGEKNPRKYGYFVRRVYHSGRMNPGKYIECTDKKGNFWQIVAQYIEPAQTRLHESDCALCDDPLDLSELPSAESGQDLGDKMTEEYLEAETQHMADRETVESKQKCNYPDCDCAVPFRCGEGTE